MQLQLQRRSEAKNYEQPNNDYTPQTATTHTDLKQVNYRNHEFTTFPTVPYVFELKRPVVQNPKSPPAALQRGDNELEILVESINLKYQELGSLINKLNQYISPDSGRPPRDTGIKIDRSNKPTQVLNPNMQNIFANQQQELSQSGTSY
ncbi:hypothetical protein RF11_05525 [Thelohanellus kitauei]|uniref:Uncharacterized protein n=1 Tax=Thelohanellus kitauei TaxID=669202 RepID=A0A0C2MCR3_THEKT|nr:hypothetical protein RF11_05525 [Thelohanellus kitauei]